MKEFKDRLIAARERAGFTQTELGESCDMAPTQVSRYEAGRAVPRRAVMQRLADALGVNYEWLAKGTGTERQFLIRLHTPIEKGEPLQLHADADTMERFLMVAREEGLPPDELLRKVVLDHLDNVVARWKTGAKPEDNRSQLEQVVKRIEALEHRIAASTATSPPAVEILPNLAAEPTPAVEPPQHDLPLPTNATRKHERKGPTPTPNAGKPKG